ncbi:hypothetical protein EFK50_10600 [Nocardioides marmoriginsengisoli]|uniref:Sulfotransferase family protein n=1 Tax=Nocardioides marmoriginsengisoli TaxID=661483 RepID=A0A3N0CFJ0_9ACTN|nr:hypothetical protein [Nocardioides marmoriginsengisoli]RNL62230.1 hypothetical protein EFK50_10600 [Nocardioides marmoriginsengisoli]
MTDSLLLPEGALLLHIGPQKTGSTAIQTAMHESRAELAAQGVLYPGNEMRPREGGWAVMGINSAVGRAAPRIARWTSYVDEIARNELPRICVSNEDFGRADDDAIARILAGTGAERTHLVYVARRLDKLLPSHWQERVKSRMTLGYEEFLHHVVDDPDRDWEARMMWESHDVGPILDRWARHLDRDRMTVIVADEADRRLTPNTFEAFLGLDEGTLQPGSTRSNTSLTFTQTEAVRRLNLMARENGWTPQQYWRIIQAGTVKALRTALEEGGPKITGLPGWAYEKVADRAEAQVAAITAAGVRVVGDPSRLLLRGNVEPAELPAEITEISLDLLADVVRGAVDGSQSLAAMESRQASRARKSPAKELGGRELVRLLGGRVARRLRLR